MKYKNVDIAIENLRKFKTSKVYKATYPKFIEFYIEKSEDEKSFFLKFWKYRLIVSIDRLIESRMAQIESEAQDMPIYKKTGNTTVTELLDKRS